MLAPRPADERLIYGAKTDSVEMMHEVLNGDAEFDVNAQDGLGNTGQSALPPLWGEQSVRSGSRWLPLRPNML